MPRTHTCTPISGPDQGEIQEDMYWTLFYTFHQGTGRLSKLLFSDSLRLGILTLMFVFRCIVLFLRIMALCPHLSSQFRSIFAASYCGVDVCIIHSLFLKYTAGVSPIVDASFLDPQVKREHGRLA